jgi:hypothetical protein
MWWYSWPEPVIPQPNQEHVEKDGRKDKVWIEDEHDEEHMNQDCGDWVFPLANITKPFPCSNESREDLHKTEEVCFASSHAPQVRTGI